MGPNSAWARLKAQLSGVSVFDGVVENRELLVSSHPPGAVQLGRPNRRRNVSRPPPPAVIVPAPSIPFDLPWQFGPAGPIGSTSDPALRSPPPGPPLYDTQGVSPLRVEAPSKKEKKQNVRSFLEMILKRWETYD
jgi:hypothetical protein